MKTVELKDTITEIKGIGPKKAEALKKLGIEKIEDLLYAFPVRYRDRSSLSVINSLEEGKPALIKAAVKDIKVKTVNYGKNKILTLIAGDDTGDIRIVFFNARYMSDSFRAGAEYWFYGRPSYKGKILQMVYPEFAHASDMSFIGIKPVYALSKGLSQKDLYHITDIALSLIDNVEEYIPSDIREKYLLYDIKTTLSEVHRPSDVTSLKKARTRIIFDELLIFKTGLILARQNAASGKSFVMNKSVSIAPFLSSLPYEFTEAQKKVTSKIISDLESGKTMNRLVQGDVGSGKTAVAEAALYKTVKSGFQGVLMAPTEILARQHYSSLKEDFEEFGISVECLTSSMKASEKKSVLKNISSGKTDIAVGTHALIQDGVEFRNLALVITDEQHRFGVLQRRKLNMKGENPHVMVMTATPVPRTLAIVIFGDLDISVIDELPPGRKKVYTKVLEEDKRTFAYDFAEKEMASGRQVYVVAPLIEDSEVMDCVSAETLYEELSKRFKGYSIELLHGNMKQEEKDRIMEQFRSGKTDMLVSTVVIEVGINVPNAVIMIIESCERFGLSQLHQLRGRIGRGTDKSYCFLIRRGNSETARKRAEIMETSNDGFYISEQDLKLRGPGELLGTRQHGIPDMHMADLVKHVKILETVSEEAENIVREDSGLAGEKYRGLKRKIEEFFKESNSLQI